VAPSVGRAALQDLRPFETLKVLPFCAMQVTINNKKTPIKHKTH